MLMYTDLFFPGDEDWFFQQDNAPCHTAKSIEAFKGKYF